MPGTFAPSDRLAQRLGAIFAFFAVVLGAMAAHGPVHDYLSRRNTLDYWRTAEFQQWVHALALIAFSHQATAPRRSVICWLIGVSFFSGSLYILALSPGSHWAGPFTPLGGLFLLAGWAFLWIRLLRGRAARRG
jgi:uncharacterized membrane protein YgdD (TMEM256/DUF423 family)